MANAITFDTFGKRLSETDAAVTTIFGYTGQQTDAETGLDYYKGRYYDPQTGRFLSQDQARDDVNLYRYVHNNPVNMTDPSGLTATAGFGGQSASSLGRFNANASLVGAQSLVWAGAGLPGPSGVYGTGIPTPLPITSTRNTLPAVNGSAADVDGGMSTMLRALQGATIQQGAAWTQDALARAWYVAKVSQLDPTDSAGRTALKVQARALSSPQGAAIAEGIRPIATEGLRIAGTASKTNATVNSTLKIAGKAAPALLAVNATISVNEIYSAPAEQRARVASREAGSWSGALAGGYAGGKVGVLIGSFFGPGGAVVGGVVGGLGGGAVGAVLGSKLGEGLYNWWNSD